jgi:hypothetical protein
MLIRTKIRRKYSKRDLDKKTKSLNLFFWKLKLWMNRRAIMTKSGLKVVGKRQKRPAGPKGRCRSPSLITQ